MKKLLLGMFVLLFFLSPIFADQEEARAKIAVIKKEINRLEAKLKTVASKAQQEKILGMIYGHHGRIRKLEEELVYNEQESPPSYSDPAPAATVIQPVPIQIPPPEAKIRQEVREHRLKFELGGGVGLFSSATAVNGEIRLPLPWIVGPATTSFRGAGCFAQTEDAARKYAFVAGDGLFNLPAGWLTGVENYLGFGINYTVVTSGRKAGTFGGQLTYGIQRSGFDGKLFGEVGWGILRTGFSPSARGVSLLVGFRKQIGLF